MNIFDDPLKLAARLDELRVQGKRIGLVPTMGALHQGHKALIEHAVSLADAVVVSVFVNPTQFGPNEDLAAYPRTLEADVDLCQKAGAVMVFAPKPEAMYPEGGDTLVDVPSLSGNLCGASRPGHFRGVATVVTKLLCLAGPCVAVFGEKDWQQLAVIRRLARDLFLPVRIVGHPTVREADGLALSSRNRYLSADERAQAKVLYAGLAEASRQVAAGERDMLAVVGRMAAYYAEHAPLGRVDYIEAVHPDTLQRLTTREKDVLFAVAVRFGQARLIDNIVYRG